MEVRIGSTVFTFDAERRAVGMRSSPVRGFRAYLPAFTDPQAALTAEAGPVADRAARLGSVLYDPSNLRYISEQTPEMCLLAVSIDGEALRWVRQQTHEICLAAVSNAGEALRFVIRQTPDICLAAVLNSPSALRHARYFTAPILMAALCDPESFEWMREHGAMAGLTDSEYESVCIAAVAIDPNHLESIFEQTNAICLAAVRSDGLALQYVRRQTPEICFAAVMQNASAEKYIVH